LLSQEQGNGTYNGYSYAIKMLPSTQSVGE